jgi:hypothetical protein
MIYSEVVLAADEYRRRLEDREYRVAHHQKLHIRLGNIHPVLALVTAGMAWESIWRHAFSSLWLAIAEARKPSRMIRGETHASPAIGTSESPGNTDDKLFTRSFRQNDKAVPRSRWRRSAVTELCGNRFPLLTVIRRRTSHKLLKSKLKRCSYTTEAGALTRMS